MAFKYRMNAKVKLVASNEVGEVVGRSDYTSGEKQYFVRYMNANGNQTKCWWDESDIEPVVKKAKASPRARDKAAPKIK